MLASHARSPGFKSPLLQIFFFIFILKVHQFNKYHRLLFSSIFSKIFFYSNHFNAIAIHIVERLGELVEQSTHFYDHNFEIISMFSFILVVFFRDSLLITIILTVNTILVQGMLSCGTQTPNWVEKTTTYMGSNRVGQLFLTKHLVTSVTLHSNFQTL